MDKELMLALVKEAGEAISQGEVEEADVSAEDASGGTVTVTLRRKPFKFESAGQEG